MKNSSGKMLTKHALEARWGRTGAVRFEERYGGMIAVLTAPGGEALVSLQGAQVLSYVPRGEDEVLWLCPDPRILPGKPLRGGIPICWPWFGPHPRDHSKPAHGFVRAAPWSIKGSAASEGRARLVLGYETSEADRALEPNRALAEIEITLDEALTVALTTENRSGTSLQLTQALHTYLRISDVDNVRISGLEARPFLDQLTRVECAGEGEPVAIGREIDRIYFETSDTVAVEDSALRRRIVIAKQGSCSTVLWNPWIGKSARLGDMGEDGYRRMVCVETANAGKDAVAIAPGARHRLVTQISVEPL